MSDFPTPNPVVPGDPLINRFFLSPSQKSDPSVGRDILKAVYAQQTTNGTSVNYFKGRNARWIESLLWAKGSQDIREFLDYMNISDANKAYLSIDTTQSRTGPQMIGTLVESMAKVKMYPCVKAIDNGSLTDKEQRLWDALYRMMEVKTINDIQQASGVQVEPTNAYVPDSERAARVYFELKDKLPKEIRFEQMLTSSMKDIHFERVLHRKTLNDLIVLNCAATKIEKVGVEKYTVRRVVPTNLIYNFFLNDTGELEVDLIGEFTNLKVKDFRAKFARSPENPNGLTEKDIFDLAALSTSQNLGTFNYQWTDQWNTNAYTYNRTRPYDDKNIMIFDAEVDFGEEMYFVEKTDPYGKVGIELKNGIPYQNTKKDGTIIEQPKPDNVEIKKRIKNTWMRGVYAPFGDKMLYWGPSDAIIPQGANVLNSLSSYTISIPNNDGEYVPSLSERMRDVERDIQLIVLKRRQIIALIEPDGWTVDIENCRNLDLGDGTIIGWEEVLRIKNQTGVQVYSSLGVDPLKTEPPPIMAGTQSNNLQKVVELTNAKAGLINELRQLVGVPQYRDGSDVGDRTAAELAQNQNTASYNVTGYIANSDKQLWEETFYKLNMLHWTDIVKTEPESKDDIINARFDVSVELKATDYEKQRLEADIQRFSQVPDAQGEPSISPKDAMMLREIGEDNYKLANEYLASIFESNRAKAEQAKATASQQQAQVASQVAAQTAQSDLAAQQQKMQAEKEMLEFKSGKEKELAIITGITGVWAKTGTIDPMYMPLVQALVPNILIPVQQENKNMGQALATASAQENAGPQTPEQAPAQPGPPMPPGGPQQNIQPQQNLQQ